MTTPPVQLQQLIQRAKVLGLSTDCVLTDKTRHSLAIADQERRQLSEQELAQICSESGTDQTLPERLQDKADALVKTARHHLIKQQPALIAEGGALYPQERAEACWRDCWNFLRVIIYAIAAGRSEFTDPEGMAALRELYALMNVPMEGMTIALDQLKQLTLHETDNPTETALIHACFVHLQSSLSDTAVKS
tara:strand:+ start:248 stop:823 length:576 start_codon:yes stop_codon:yes gene_type:complete